MGIEHALHRRERVTLFGRVDRGVAEHRRESRGEQQPVAVAHGHVQGAAEVKEHVAAGMGAAGLHEAQMARRHTSAARQLELAQAPVHPPLAQ